jgi:hypothetical protein
VKNIPAEADIRATGCGLTKKAEGRNDAVAAIPRHRRFSLTAGFVKCAKPDRPRGGQSWQIGSAAAGYTFDD